MFKENLELREAIFRKMGWVWDDVYAYEGSSCCGAWIVPQPNRIKAITKLPPIETTWEVTAQYLVPFMGEKGWVFKAILSARNSYMLTYNPAKQDAWVPDDNLLDIRRTFPSWWEIKKEIIDNNIALAACEAVMEVKGDSTD